LVVSVSGLDFLFNVNDGFKMPWQIWTSTRRRAHHTAWPFLSPETTLNASPSIFRHHSSSSISSATSTPHNQEHRNTATPLVSPSPFSITSLQSPSLHAQSPAPLGSGGEIDASPAALLDPITNVKVVEKQQMSEINPGVWDGLTPDQARKYYPEEWERFMKDPYAFRAPRAESYHDLSGECA
jgi:6-phosphofructo-2-kinase / fructose-2,6-biphosphatase 4